MIAPWVKRKFLPFRFWLEFSTEWRLAIIIGTIFAMYGVVFLARILQMEGILTNSQVLGVAYLTPVIGLLFLGLCHRIFRKIDQCLSTPNT